MLLPATCFKPTRQIHSLRWIYLTLICCLLAHPAFVQAENTLSLAMVDERLSALRESGAAEDSSIYKNYSDARNLLVQAEVFQLEKQKFVEALRSAPIEESEAQGRIEKLEAAPQEEDDLTSLDRNELNARLLTLRSDEEEAADALNSLDRRLAARETSAAKARERLAAIREQAELLPEDLSTTGAGGNLSESEAISWKAAAEDIALRAERQAIEAQLSSQAIRYSLMAVERTEQQLFLSQLSRSVRALEAEMAERSLELADAGDMGLATSDPLYPVAQSLIEKDTALSEERLATNEQLTRARQDIEDIKTRSSMVKERYAIARRMVDFAAGSDSLGKLLLTHWQELQDNLGDGTSLDIPTQHAKTVIRRIELEDTLKQLSSSSTTLDNLLSERGVDPALVSRDHYNALRELISTYRKRLNATIDTQSVYLDTLTLLADSSAELSRLSQEYSVYLTARILWIPNFSPLWQSDFSSVSQELDAMLQDLDAMRFQPGFIAILALLVFGFVRARREQLSQALDSLNQKIVKPRGDSILHSLNALLCSLLLALPIPVLLAGLGYSMTGNSALGSSITRAAIALLLLAFTRRICAPQGVGAIHFGWPAIAMARLYHDVFWLMVYWLPLLTIIGWIIQTTPTQSDGILSRSVIVVVLLPSLALSITRMLKEARANEEHWLSNGLQKLRVFFAAGLAFIAIAIVLGHVYSVGVLFECLLNTLLVALGLLLLYSVLIRWIQVTRRRLRMAELLSAHSDSDMAEEQAAGLGDVSEDSRELVNAFLAAAAIASLIYIWSPLLPALGRFSDISLWTTTTLLGEETIENRITLATILIIAALATLTVYASRKLPAVIDLLLRSQTGVSTSTRYTVSSLLNYTILGVGSLAAFSAMGLQWSQMQWLVAALGVGIGFGLQEIIANFISGLIILFERPIRVGDVVSTGDKDGIVTRIRIRATTIVDWDGKELLVPNKEFITGRVLNWSLTDSKVRLILPVGIAYGSDVEKALRILSEIVSNHPRVLEDPEPSIIFDAFGDNALSLVARCFLGSMENRLGVVTEMNREIYRRFEEAGIVIAFPQRDIHFDSDKPLRIALENNSKDG